MFSAGARTTLNDDILALLIPFLSTRDSLAYGATCSFLRRLAVRHAVRDVSFGSAEKLTMFCAFMLAQPLVRLPYLRRLTLMPSVVGSLPSTLAKSASSVTVAALVSRAFNLKYLCIHSAESLLSSEPLLARAVELHLRATSLQLSTYGATTQATLLALRCAPTMKTLVLSDADHRFLRPPAQNIIFPSLPSLKTLVLDHIEALPPLATLPILTPSLNTLHIRGVTFKDADPPAESWWDALHTLRGDIPSLVSLCVPRPLRCLQVEAILDNERGWDPGPLYEVLRRASPLCLSIGMRADVKQPLWRTYATAVPRLRFIEVIVECDSHDGDDFQQWLPNISEPGPESLLALKVHLRTTQTVENSDHAGRQTALQILSAAACSLRTLRLFAFKFVAGLGERPEASARDIPEEGMIYWAKAKGPELKARDAMGVLENVVTTEGCGLALTAEWNMVSVCRMFDLPLVELPVIHDIHCDFDERLMDVALFNFPRHVLIRYEVCYDHRTPPDFDEVFLDAKRWLDDYPREKLQKGIEEDDAPCMLEACLRRMSGCESGSEGFDDLMERLERLSGLVTLERPEGMDDAPFKPVRNNTPEIQKRALAAWAWVFFEMFFLFDPEASLRSLTTLSVMQNAACCAETCAADAFLPPIIPRIANWLFTLKPRFGLYSHQVPRFGDFPCLWAGWMLYVKTSENREYSRLEKVSSAPNQYRCAADGCGIQTLHKSVLRKCSGNCPPETKPHYCSRLCQYRHWFVHQYVCKKGLPEDPIIDDDGDPDWEDIDIYQTRWDCYDLNLEDKFVWSWAHSDGGIFIDIKHPSAYHKGETFRIHSKTLSSQFLHSYRFHWQMPHHARIHQEERASCIFFVSPLATDNTNLSSRFRDHLSPQILPKRHGVRPIPEAKSC
ncbi:hypothetical protein C8Q79DRAFT_920935 [Trametes meyenii]|nr:hypothetical protein C8Q79DRAFT_920935 [Trametes meyenii]